MPKPHAPSRPKAPLARYANYFEVGHNAYEFLLDYGQYQPDTSSVVLHTRVALGPTHAKMLATMLNSAVERYEREHGAIHGAAEVLDPIDVVLKSLPDFERRAVAARQAAMPALDAKPARRNSTRS
jgi:hypothetical protein